jgi:hypothetical protein
MKEGFDREMDSLLRRAARASSARANGAGASQSVSHLDADELAAFAEGALPEAARMSAVSHLADCEGCRALAFNLTRAAGVEAELEKRAAAAEAPAPSLSRESKAVEESKGFKESRPTRGWLAALFAPRTLRYVAPALALCLVAVVSFVAIRSRSDEGTQLARREPSQAVAPAPAAGGGAGTQPEAAAQPSPVEPAAASASATPGVAGTAGIVAPVQQSRNANAADAGGPVGGSAPAPVAEAKGGEVAADDSPPPPPPAASAKEGDDKAKREAPAQPTDVLSARVVEAPPAPKVGVNAKAGPPPSSPSDDEVVRVEEQRQQQQKRDAQNRYETQAPDGGNMRSRSNSAANNVSGGVVASRRARNSQDAPASESEQRAGERRAEETRAVAGHRFRREGGAWVDVNYKSSMASTGVRRGSDSYRALVADIPEIGRAAEQLGGEVVVVVRGRAYRIR